MEPTCLQISWKNHHKFEAKKLFGKRSKNMEISNSWVLNIIGYSKGKQCFHKANSFSKCLQNASKKSLKMIPKCTVKSIKKLYKIEATKSIRKLWESDRKRIEREARGGPKSRTMGSTASVSNPDEHHFRTNDAQGVEKGWNVEPTCLQISWKKQSQIRS